MSRFPLLICSVLACAALAAAAISTAERRAIIEAAAKEAKNHASVQATAAKQGGPSARLRAFKVASPETVREGKARLLFEDMVRRAEKKLFEKERQTMRATSAEAKAEELARELLHHPGSKLQSDELARLFQQSGCEEILEEDEDNPIDCRSFPSVSVHRTITGVCNNLDHPLFGARPRPFRRLVPPFYEDGVSQLRGQMQSMQSYLFFQGPFGSPNPSARLVSETVVRDRTDEQDGISHMTMQWGQFLDHDYAEAPQFDCPLNTCDIETGRCVPIRVAEDDQAFGGRLACHPFPRSLPACEEPESGTIPPRQQVNEVTSFIDGSQVYGSNAVVFNAVKEPGTAKLRVGPPIPAGGGDSLPTITCDPEPADCLVGCPDRSQPCFLAGDVRVNEQTSLTVMHTIWVREHNRIAEQLAQINPHWSPDKVFNVTREIVGAEIQKITYKDYLQNVIFGPAVFNQLLLSFEDSAGYQPSIDATVPNGFATAAYRFGHSQIQPFFDRLDENFNNISAGPLPLVNAFFQPTSYEESGGTDPILRGLLTRQARRIDEFINEVLTTQLFALTDASQGMDLVTLNIQRGRDHGLPPYLVWKKWAQRECNVSSNFRNELTEIRLLQLYGSLDTVDLFVGALAEENLPGALVGATIACIFARTFGPLRNGDRFYYENTQERGDGGFFTEAQRDEIEKTSLSRVICDTADNINNIQPDAFRVATSSADRVPCSQLPQVDLNAFREEQGTCALRVRLSPRGSATQFRAESRVGSSRGPRTITTSTIPSGEREACLYFTCPTAAANTFLTVVIRSGTQLGCSENANMRNPALPRDTTFLGIPTHQYRAALAPSHISSTSGAYPSMGNCRSGDAVGLVYSCRNVQQQSDGALAQELEQALSQSNHASEDSSEKEELISVLETYIHKLKNENDDTNKQHSPTEDGDTNLMTELANALNELEN